MEELDTSPASINELEALVYQKQYAEAESLLVRLIRLYGKDKISFTLAPFNRRLSPEQQDLESYQVIEKLAFVLTAWFSNFDYSPSKQFFSYIAMQKNFLGNIFAASSYHSTDHIVSNLGLLGKSNYSPEEIRRILFVFTIESDIALPWDALLQHLPDETAQAFTGLISSIGIQLSKRAEKNISVLLETVKLLPTIKTDQIKNLGPLIKAYFNCSNLANPNKYELKKWIVRTIEESMTTILTPGVQKRIKNEVKAKPDNEKPTVLVIHEIYKNNHAMYRGHHPRIAALKEKFHVIGMGQEGSFDRVGQLDFDENITFPESDGFEIEKLIKLILKQKPDLILYPSLGMSFYAPFLASQRLAPVQVVSAGHPSSSYFDAIDYFHCLDVGVGREVMENIISEKWLPNKREGLFRKEQRFTLNVDAQINNKTNVLINGVIQKVSSALIETCQAITMATSQQITFHMFMAHPKQDIEYFAAKSLLRRFLPNAIIHPFESYSQYMNIVNSCLFALPTFPFGGTNSNIDLIRLHKPKLFVVDKTDISGLSDLDIWQSVDYLKGKCDTVEEIQSRAISWINNPSELASVVDDMKSQSLNNKINSQTKNSVYSELVTMFEVIFSQGEYDDY